MSVIGEDMEGCRGPQAVACKERGVRNLGDPRISYNLQTGWYTGIRSSCVQRGVKENPVVPSMFGIRGREAKPKGEEAKVSWEVGSAHSTLRAGEPSAWGRG